MTATVDFVEILAQNVEETAKAGRLFFGAHVSTVLRGPYEAAGMAISKGCYRPVIDEAIARRRVRRLYPVRGGGGDILIPFNAAVPPGYHEAIGPSTAIAEGAGMTLGLPIGTAFLKKEIYRAFAGLDQPRFADASTPPYLRLSAEEGPSTIKVEPVSIEDIKVLWDKLSKELGIDAGEQVRSQLDSINGAWGKLNIPGDSTRTHWGATFSRHRMGLLVQHIQAWAEKHGLDLNNYSLIEPSRRTQEPSDAPGVNRVERRGSIDRVDELRRRLKLAIDRMTLQQLCELRIPAEFLID